MASYANMTYLLIVSLCLLQSNIITGQLFNKVLVDRDTQTFKILTEIDPDPKILVAITIRNNSYSLPTFLSTLETLRCKNVKNKCDLWVIFDQSTDKNYDMFTYWLSNTREMFDSIIMLRTRNDEIKRSKHVSAMRLEYF